MPGHSMPVKEARKIAERIAQEMQVELVDVELVKEPTGHFLRFYVDRPEGIAVNDLEAFHRRIMPLVERVEYDYMEVSSPGADRQLKTERDFERAAGGMVSVKTYRAVNGAKEFAGILMGLEGNAIVLQDAEGREMRFDRKAVAVVRPLIEFDEEDLQDDVPVQ